MRIRTGLTIASLLFFCDLVQGQSLLKERYKISGPEFEYGELQFTMDFEVSDFVQDSMVEYTLYDGLNCKDGGDNDITENEGYLVSRLRTDLTPVGDGSGVRTVKVLSEIVPTGGIGNSPLYREDDDGNAVVEYCVRFSVYNMPKDQTYATETNYLEIPVKLVINLRAGFEIDASVSNSDVVLRQASQNTAVDAYICDSEDNIVPIMPTEQGQTVRVCVSPTPPNLAVGALMRQLESFTFRRESPIKIEQVAISPNTGGVPADELTVVSCRPGSTVCAFETLLTADFFINEGVVVGNGLTYLQLGPGTSAVSRRLEGTPNQILADKPTGFSVMIKLMEVESSYQVAATSGAASTPFATTCMGLGLLSAVLALF